MSFELFEPKHLNQLPDVLIDILKSYILPELRLAELGITCTDPEINIEEPKLANSIFCKKWTHTDLGGRIFHCDPKPLTCWTPKAKVLNINWFKQNIHSYDVRLCSYCQQRFVGTIFVASNSAKSSSFYTFCPNCRLGQNLKTIHEFTTLGDEIHILEPLYVASSVLTVYEGRKKREFVFGTDELYIHHNTHTTLWFEPWIHTN